MKRAAVLLAVVGVCCTLSSCRKANNRLETYPVTGDVYVDGAPVADLAVRCHNVNGIDQTNPTSSSAFTDENGHFEISTYESGDGIPEGEYALTFEWGQRNLISASYGGPDKLNNRYRDPEQSSVKFTVTKGQPTDLGRIDLTTQ